MQQPLEDGPWSAGCDSVSNPLTLPPGRYQWGINCVNKGGIISTRPGMRVLPLPATAYLESPGSLKIFTPKSGVPCLVASMGIKVFFQKYPFTGPWEIIPGVEFADGKCEFEVAVVAVSLAEDTSVTAIEPFPVLMMFDGQTRTAFWDGVTARHLDPGPDEQETPICTWAKWIGNRLWTAHGKKIRVSDLLNPLKFTEEDILAEGGYFNLPDDCTGLGVTPNFMSLLAFTESTTTAFQAGILNRTQWQLTNDFQKVIFANIGCAAGRSIVNQYGMMWWYSNNGLMNLDSALQTYRSSEIRYRDSQMRRSRSNFSDDISGICAVAFENYLLIAVPSGDMHNYHTWVMDGNPVESVDSPAQWASVWTGVRPTQFASGIINGKARCFCLSRDLPPDDWAFVIPHQTNAWELFLQDRRDIGRNVHGTTVAKDIDVAFETRIMSANTQSTVKYAEFEIGQAIGTIQLDIDYCPLRGTYKNMLSQQLVATVGNISPPDTIPVTFTQYLPQRRTIRTSNEALLPSDSSPPVETDLNRNKDRAFSLLVKWTGQMAMIKARLHLDPDPEANEGMPTETETTDRYIAVDGTGAITDTTPPTDLPIQDQQSGFLNTTTPRWSEGIYKSLT